MLHSLRFRQARQNGGERRPSLAKPGGAYRFEITVLQSINPNGRFVFPHVVAASQGSA